MSYLSKYSIESDHWSLPPQSLVDPSQNENQALITIEYNKIDPKLSHEFEQSVHELGRLLKSEGMGAVMTLKSPNHQNLQISYILLADSNSLLVTCFALFIFPLMNFPPIFKILKLTALFVTSLGIH